MAADHQDTPIEKGRQLFTESAGETGCAVCHGETAVGNPDTGAPFIQGISRARLNAALTGAVPAMEYFKLNRGDTDAIFEFLQYMSHAEDLVLNEDAAAGKKSLTKPPAVSGVRPATGQTAAVIARPTFGDAMRGPF